MNWKTFAGLMYLMCGSLLCIQCFPPKNEVRVRRMLLTTIGIWTWPVWVPLYFAIKFQPVWTRLNPRVRRLLGSDC